MGAGRKARRLQKRSQGIAFLLNGHSPLPSFVIALYTLKKHYNGKICVFVRNVDQWFLDRLTKVENVIVDTTSVDIGMKMVSGWNYASERFNSWNVKPILHKMSPFEVTVFYDCDIVFVSHFDDAIFESAYKNELITSYLRCGHREKRKALMGSYLSNIIKGKPFIVGANGGCVASKRDSDDLLLWFGTLSLMRNLQGGYRHFPIDEYSLAYVLQTKGEADRYIDNKWGIDVGYLINGESSPGTVAIHCNKKKYACSNQYLRSIVEAMKDDFLGIASDARFSGLDDKWDRSKPN